METKRRIWLLENVSRGEFFGPWPPSKALVILIFICHLVDLVASVSYKEMKETLATKSTTSKLQEVWRKANITNC